MNGHVFTYDAARGTTAQAQPISRYPLLNERFSYSKLDFGVEVDYNRYRAIQVSYRYRSQGYEQKLYYGQ
jgi:hypothetical protein